MSNTVDSYMEQVEKLLSQTKDNFASQNKDDIIKEIRDLAMINWLSSGEPILTPEQMLGVYDLIRKKKTPKNFEYLCGFKICLN